MEPEHASSMSHDSGRILGDAEPPNLATEKNARRGVIPVRDAEPPLRVQIEWGGQDPAESRDFSANAGGRSESLCSGGLNGGGCSPSGTRL